MFKKIGLKLIRRRTILIHNHLFKNAGSTIDWALRRNFGECFVDHRDDEQMRMGAAYLGPYLLQNRGLRALSTHHLSLPLPKLSRVAMLHLVMIRHPIERVTSVYHFERAQCGATTPGAINARKLSMRDYVVWRMRPEVGPTIRDFHVIRLMPSGQGEAQAVDAAMRVLQSSLFGVVERFDESMVVLEYDMENMYFPVDLAYVKQNVNRDYLGMSRTERIDSLRQEIGDDVFSILMEGNQRDLRLYAWVEGEFQERISKIPNFDARLASFKRRCDAMRDSDDKISQ